MPAGDPRMLDEPPRVSILSQGSYLIASIHTALDDEELLRFRRDLIDRVGRHRARGVVIDVAVLDVIDSFAANTLRQIAQLAALRGAETVVVGIDPTVALSMVTFGSLLPGVHTALDLEEGLALLDDVTGETHGLLRRDRVRDLPR